MACISGCLISSFESGSVQVNIGLSGGGRNGNCIEYVDDPEGIRYICSGVSGCSFEVTATFLIQTGGNYNFRGYSGSLNNFLNYNFVGTPGQRLIIPVAGEIPCGILDFEVDSIYQVSGSRLATWGVSCTPCSGSGSYG